MKLYFLAPKIPFGLNQTKNTIERESKENYFLQNFLYSFLSVIENAIFLFLLFHTFVFYPTIKHQQGSRNRASPPSHRHRSFLLHALRAYIFYITFVFAPPPPSSLPTDPSPLCCWCFCRGWCCFSSFYCTHSSFSHSFTPKTRKKSHHRLCTHRLPMFLILQ